MSPYTSPMRARAVILVFALVASACAPTPSTTTTPPATATVPPAAPTTETTTTVPEVTTSTTVPLAEPVEDTWTLVLASIPIGEGAEATTREMASRIPGSGVLLSNDYPSLNPGYWVVFLGSAEDEHSLTCPTDLGPEYSCYPRWLGDPPVRTAIAMLGADLVEIDVTTGTTVRTIEPFFAGDGLFRYGLALTPDRGEAYFSENWEDSWYSCDTSPGSVGRVDLETGAVEGLWTGTGITVSPDGRFVAYLEASQCLPDPEAPDLWVLTPYDRVVVVDLAIAEPAFMDSRALPTGYDDPNALTWVRFHPDGDVLVGTASDDVYRVPLGAANPVQSHPRVLSGIEGWPVEVVGEGLVVVEPIDIGYALASYDLDTGVRSELWTSETWVIAGADPDGDLIASFEDRVYPDLGDGVPVGGLVHDLDW